MSFVTGQEIFALTVPIFDLSFDFFLDFFWAIDLACVVPDQTDPATVYLDLSTKNGDCVDSQPITLAK